MRPSTTRNRRLPAMALLVITTSAGCSQFIDPNVPEPIRACVEPRDGNPYLLYRPSSYDRDLAWPLLIVCHSTFPDSRKRQIRHWTQLAESQGFLVAVPRLKGVRARLAPKAAKQVRLQRTDERHILGTVRHVRAGHNISQDRIFIHGYAGGAYAALTTGLRHPELFRTVSLLRPRFNESYLGDVPGSIDPYQSVLVHYSVTDTLTGKDARRCVDWLRSKGVNLTEDSIGPARAHDTRRTVAFLEETSRKHAWIQVRAFPAEDGNPLSVQFKLRCSEVPAKYRWEFGDKDESPVAEPLHIYAEPGTYRVTVWVENSRGRRDRRVVDVTVPHAKITRVSGDTK